MNKEKVEYFTSKISSGSMTSIICTMYEIFFEYTKDAKLEGGVDLDSIRRADKVIVHLKNALDFKYEISNNLFSLYDYCDRLLSKAMYTNQQKHIEEAESIMRDLYESFLEVDKQSDSNPVMSNSQQVTAGLTYGKNDLSEVLNNDGNRGFLA